MKRQAAMLAVLFIAGCSAESSKQVASSAVMGAALGVPAGPIGIALGGVVGAAAGVVLPPGTLQALQADAD